MSLPFKLFRLQQIDSQIDQIDIRLKEIDLYINDTSTINEMKKNKKDAEYILEEGIIKLKRSEESVQNQRIKIEKNESALYGGKIQNPKELQDIQNEVAALNKYLNVLEDRQLEAMISFENAQDIYKAAVNSFIDTNNQLSERNKKLLVEQDSLSKEREQLKKEREVAASTIPSDVTITYEQLRIHRSGVAVSRITDNTCSACGSTLNSSLLQSARGLTQITRCNSCGRMLYGG